MTEKESPTKMCPIGDTHNKHKGVGLVALQEDLNEARGVDEWAPWQFLFTSNTELQKRKSPIILWWCLFVVHFH